MNKRTIATTAALLAVGLIVGFGPAQAKTKTTLPPARTIDVHTHYTEPAGSVGGAECWGVATLTLDCRLHYVGPITFTGTIWGDAYTDTRNGPLAPDGKIPYEGPDYIDGGVKGCGTGTYIIDTYEGYVDMNQFDIATGTAPGYNKWRLRPGSGTGQLTNLVSGEGENHWTVYFFGGNGGDPERFGEGDFTGTITCRR